MADRDTVLGRIRKFLALANNNTNPHEAAVAAARAQQLMVEHKIAMLELETPADADADEIAQTDILRSKKPMTPWRRELLSVLSVHCFCQVVLVRSAETGAQTARVVGLPEDADVLAELYVYLEREINRLCTSHGGNKQPRAWRTNFRRGAVVGVHHTLSEQAKMQMSDSRALVVYQRSAEAVKEYVADKYPKLKQFKSRELTVPDAAAIGFRAGADIAIRQPGSKPKLEEAS
jgi:hypothetical protein